MLRLTKKTEYAIIALKCIIAEQERNPQVIVSASEIAKKFNIGLETAQRTLTMTTQ